MIEPLKTNSPLRLFRHKECVTALCLMYFFIKITAHFLKSDSFFHDGLYNG